MEVSTLACRGPQTQEGEVPENRWAWTRSVQSGKRKWQKELRAATVLDDISGATGLRGCSWMAGLSCAGPRMSVVQYRGPPSVRSPGESRTHARGYSSC